VSADVVIVGGGLEGVSAAWALTRRGVTDVTVVERDTVGSGGTGKSSGIVRCHYGVPSLAAMAWKGLQLFENAGELLGDDIGFRQTGYMVGVGEPNVGALQANLAMQRRLGIEVEQVSHDAVADLWPVARLDDFAAFGYEPRGGYGDAYRTAQAFAAAARRAGARVEQGRQVTELLAAGDKVRGVRLADGVEVHAGTVVVAAGPWSVALLAPLGVELPITVHREPIVLVSPGTDLSGTPVLSDLVSLQYVRSEPGGTLLFGNSDLSTLEPADPDAYRNSAGESFVERAVEKMMHRFPGLPDAAISSSYAGCYDVTPDFNPVISLTGIAGLVVAAGFSGHGFKISPAVGALVADLVCEGASTDPDIPASDFRLSRFAENDPLTSPHPYVGAGQLR
jgi:glycine/D-amino acid oxidase-like deaminating enzyme